MANGIVAIIVTFFSLNLFASPETICGSNDDRVLSFDTKIGRLSELGKYKGCTATLISDSCAITAGHCKEVLDVIEFNTPASKDGVPVPSELHDLYRIDQASIVSEFDGKVGNDYAVFKILPNEITGKLPGVLQGHYNVSFKKPSKGDKIRITGYGVDEGDATGNFAQQTHTGKIKSMGGFFQRPSIITYDVDTTGGNSGSSIILESTNEIIGIHAMGGCSSFGGTNKGTLIAKHAELQKAIKACLQSDR